MDQGHGFKAQPHLEGLEDLFPSWRDVMLTLGNPGEGVE